MSPRFAMIFGTRPEIIKMAPFVRTAAEGGRSFFIIHTGQHYTEIMDRVFWKNLELPEPAFHLGVGSGTHAEQVGRMMVGIERTLADTKPDAVCVYADVNTAIAGALAAAKLGVPIVQLEAGLRSFDRSMPEEINRVVVDRIATHHFAPTELQREHLRREGITENVFVAGNLIADAVVENVEKAKRLSTVLERLVIEPGCFFLATIHRAGGVDDPNNFKNMLDGLGRVAARHGIPVVYPIHPRSKKNLETFGLSVPPGVRLIDPVDYFDFLTLEADARLILSDSGGIQEEASILRVPLVTLRENTERQETLEIGCNILSGFAPESIEEKVSQMLARPRDWRHPYGENVARKMWDILDEKFGR